MKLQISALAASALVVSLASANGASIFSNAIDGTNPNTSNPFTSGQVVDANITISGIGRGSGITGNNGDNRYNASSWNTATLDGTAYFTFTLMPNEGYEIQFDSFEYTSQRSNASISQFAFRSSLDGFAEDIGAPTFSGTSIDLSSLTSITGAVEFRFYAWGASSSANTFSINSFSFNGAAVPLAAVPEPTNALAGLLIAAGLFRRHRGRRRAVTCM